MEPGQAGTGMLKDKPLIEKKAFLKLPLKEKRKLLAEQAAKLVSVYNEDPETPKNHHYSIINQ